MSSNLVIVAIPDENDRVWKVSSEKVPHLTMLFLGDADKVPNLDQIMLFVEHAASTSLKRFYLPVDRRGELGDDKADVLFFKKGRYDFAAVRDFRNLLLKDPNIKTAYDSTRQFEAPEAVGLPGQPWLPHLTLGYPTSPAKKIPDDQISNFFEVSFNKIAVWTGDFDGPEFLLKDYWEEFDETAIPMDVAMSDLEHYGTKGMKWGVRKSTTEEGGRREGIQRYLDPQGHELGSDVTKTAIGIIAPIVAPLTWPAQIRLIRGGVRGTKAKLTDREEKKFTKKAQSAENFVAIHNGATDRINREVSTINKQYSDTAMKNPTQKKKYDGEVQKLMQDSYRQSAKSLTNKRRTMHLDVEFKNDGYDFTIHAKEGAPTPLPKRVEHAAGDEDETITFSGKIKRDAIGYIIGFEFEDFEQKSMAQTVDLGAEFLAHLSEEPWSNFSKADYTLEQWHAACLIHTHEGEPTSKSECKLPVKTPDGALNRNGVHAAAAALAGARGGLKGVSDDQKKKAGNALKRYYSQLDEQPPESLSQSVADLGAEFILEHYGVKGMRWGQRRASPIAVTPMGTSHVPHGKKRKTKVKTEGGEHQPASNDAIKVAESRAKLKRSGTAALSNQELRDVANRLQLEAQVATLTTSRGQKFVMRELETTTQQLAKSGVKSAAKNVTKKKVKKAAATAAVTALL
jgi:2'-5' RNA ligase